MSEKPILFSAPMVRAILDGRKTQTRQVVKIKSGEPKTIFPLRGRDNLPTGEWFFTDPEFERVGSSGHFCPYGKPGDRLWVREAWLKGWPADGGEVHQFDDNGNELPATYWYRATPPKNLMWTTDNGSLTDRIPWKPSIHMPRWASRITLEITEVRVQRLQEISEEDATGEGAPRGCEPNGDGTYKLTYTGTHRWGFQYVWESINGPGSWDANPWVWAISFQRVAEVPATA